MGQHEAVPAEDLAVGRVARVGRTAGGGEHRRLELGVGVGIKLGVGLGAGVGLGLGCLRRGRRPPSTRAVRRVAPRPD